MNQQPQLMEAVSRAKLDDPEAMDQLLKTVREAMKGYFARRVGMDESSDLAQEVIIKVADNLNRFDGSDETQFWAWVTRMGKNLWRDACRHDNRAKRNPGQPVLPLEVCQERNAPADTETPSRVAQTRESEAKILETLKAMAPTDQLVIQLRYFEEKPWEEIAEAINKTESATRKLYQRAVKKWHSASSSN